MFSFLKPKKRENMWLLVGLGNPGDKYAGNRHNIGFMVVDRIAEDNGFTGFKDKFQGQYTEGRLGGQKVMLLKPQTYMNESGQSVGKAAKFYKIPPEKVIVFHDELDLDPFKDRLKTGGGAAGHNGLKSIKAHLGTPDFVRVRLGIGHPGSKDKVSPYVLNDFAKAEQDMLERCVDGASRYIDLLISDKGDDYMTRVAENIKG